MSNTNEHSNKRIAKNTIMLYFRMLLSMFVSLYTSRVVLQTLGVEDYGIYGVVGGVVAMFSFLNASMSGATSRFLTYEMGRKDSVKLNETFSTAIIVHLGISLIVFVLAETVGLWFLEYKLVIPIERMNAARIVYQASVFSAILGITQVPYNACIISNEKMDIYAYIEILNVILRLVIIYLLVIGNIDKLILYAILVLAVSTLITLIYRLYCLKHFKESNIKWIYRPKILKPMLSFSGWDLYGNASTVARNHGVNLLLNMFFGAALNAANAIAISVQTVVSKFATNIIVAVNPQIVKSYASGDYYRMESLVYSASKLTSFLLLIISLPIMLEMHYILSLWLGIVPNFAVDFCIYTLLFNFFSNMSYVVGLAIHATGNIKRLSLITGSIYLAVLPFAYFAYKLGASPVIAYIFNVGSVIIGLACNVHTVSIYIPSFSFRKFF